MKKLLFVMAIVAASATASFAQNGRIGLDVVIGNRQPNPTELNLMRAEEANHPNIAQAMHDCENAMQHLAQAPSNFGGHKGQASMDLKAAWISLRKALYYRIYADSHQ